MKHFSVFFHAILEYGVIELGIFLFCLLACKVSRNHNQSFLSAILFSFIV